MFPPHDMWGSSSSWSTQAFGSSSSCPGAGFGPTTGFASTVPWGSVMPPCPSWSSPASCFGPAPVQSSPAWPPRPPSFGPSGWLSEKGSRVSPYNQTAEDHPDKAAWSPNFYFQSISAMPVYSSKSHEELRHEDYIWDQGGVSLPSPIVPVSSPPSTELQPVKSPNCSSNPFWLPSAQLKSPISSGHLQSSKQGPCASTSSLSFSFPVSRSMGIQTPPSFPVSSDQPQTEFQRNPSSYSPSSLAIPHGSALLGTETHTASATTSSTKSKATFRPNFSISTSPATRQENVFSNSAAAYTMPAGTTSVNVDYANNTIELLLPADISLVKIKFSSQVHSDHAARASETPISLSIYPGENEELIIQSIKQPPKCQTGKQSSSTAGSYPNDQRDCSKVRNSAAYPPRSGSIRLGNRSSSDVHLTQKSLNAPACEVITESVLPRLYNADYYTIPSIVELAVRESDEPGYCARVQDFTVGRYGYGSVKFDGETDVRKLDITSILEFNNREILVYRDERKAPDVGQELNKPAEVTLLNVKCIDRKTGLQLTEGPAVDRYKEVLVQWTKDHDAEFMSFNAVRGEWKFRVKNFRQ